MFGLDSCPCILYVRICIRIVRICIRMFSLLSNTDTYYQKNKLSKRLYNAKTMYHLHYKSACHRLKGIVGLVGDFGPRKEVCWPMKERHIFNSIIDNNPSHNFRKTCRRQPLVVLRRVYLFFPIFKIFHFSFLSNSLCILFIPYLLVSCYLSCLRRLD